MACFIATELIIPPRRNAIGMKPKFWQKFSLISPLAAGVELASTILSLSFAIPK
jgi:hypothetical protein